MSAEAKKPEDVVHDGVQNGADPVPKEPGSSAQVPAGATERAADAAANADSDDPTGPAEDQDEAKPDGRGLTTKLSPSD